MEHFDSAYRQTRELISMRPRMGQYNYVPHVQIHVALRQRGWSRRHGEHVICHMCQMYFLVYFLTLFAEYAQQGLCNGRMSVRLSVCLSACSIIRPPHAAAAGLAAYKTCLEARTCLENENPCLEKSGSVLPFEL